MPPKKGKTEQIGKTTTSPAEKDFAGSGVEGQKAAETDEDKAAAEKAEADRLDAEKAAAEKQAKKAAKAKEEKPAPAVEPTIVRGEDVLKTMRERGVKI